MPVRDFKHISHANNGPALNELGTNTGVKCPNCDNLVSLPDTIDPEFGAPTCDLCGCVLYGYAHLYIPCRHCSVEFDESLNCCPECGAKTERHHRFS
jgi:hypothetical protein